jgi:hypothetical protein
VAAAALEMDVLSRQDAEIAGLWNKINLET